jgi:hypothetical protein
MLLGSGTHALIPDPISRHEVTVTTLFILDITVGDVIEASGFEIWICKDAMDDFPWIMIPELVLFIHPTRRNRIFRLKALMLCSP